MGRMKDLAIGKEECTRFRMPPIERDEYYRNKWDERRYPCEVCGIPENQHKEDRDEAEIRDVGHGKP